MHLERWPISGEKRWDFLRRVSSAITGKDVEVIPGTVPSCTAVAPKDYLSRIYLPARFLGNGQERFLDGALAHEVLHVLITQPFVLVGQRLHHRIMTNALEDARVETQLADSWPGLVRPVKQLTKDLIAFRKRSRELARSAEISRLYEVALALYLRLTTIPETEVQKTVTPMAAAVAHEVFPIAQKALVARDTKQVAEVAREICEALAKAAEKAARRLNTPAARSWVRSFTKELTAAAKTTLEEILFESERRSFPGWFGPWLRGGGGFSFFSSTWTWKEPEDPVSPLATEDIHRVLLRADPLVDEWTCERNQIHGRLTLGASTLVRAALGHGQPRAFQREEHTQRMILPTILQSIEILVFIEAHARYSSGQWLFLKALTASLARLLALSRVPLFVVRAATTTRAKEWVEDKSTKRRYERWSRNHYVEIATLKGPDEGWGRSSERMLASMPRKGFNQPLEAYGRMRSWELKVPQARRLRFHVVIGDAGYINVVPGHLKHATASLRGRRCRAAYVHVGRALASYDPRLKELHREFDIVVQASTLMDTLVKLLREIVIEYASPRWDGIGVS